MNNAILNFKEPKNEPMQSYLQGSKEYELLVKELERQSNLEIEIPLIIGGKEIHTGDTGEVVTPHNHKHVLAKYHKSRAEDVKNAIDAALDAKEASDAKIICGGEGDKSVGYFIKPTIIETTNPKFKTMQEEIFGPVMTIFIYEDNKFEETLKICDKTSFYALTGSIFSNDKYATIKACKILLYAAGNFYYNDKPSGAMVGLQPFGGSRASGTNDKAGSYLNLLCWTSPRTIKETLLSPTDFKYPYMTE